MGVLTNRAFNISIMFCLIGQLLTIYLPFLQSIFQTSSLTMLEMLYLIALSSIVFVFDEIKKRFGQPVHTMGTYESIVDRV